MGVGYKITQRNISKFGEIEISVNSSNPKSVIYKLPDGFTNQEGNEEEEGYSENQRTLVKLRLIRLPNITQWSICVKDNVLFDLIGKVTFVGRSEREKISSKPLSKCVLPSPSTFSLLSSS